MATLDDLDGITANLTQAVDVSGALRCIIYLDNTGAAGTAGIDVVEISHDLGVTWVVDTTIMLMTANDNTGTILASGALMAAGVEPTTTKTSIWKSGPYFGPTAMRIGRKTTTTNGTTWVTGAPEIGVFLIGGKHSGGAPSFLA